MNVRGWLQALQMSGRVSAATPQALRALCQTGSLETRR